MRKFVVCFIAVVAACSWSSSALAVNLIYEPFDYTSGVDLAGQRNTSAGTTAGQAVQADTTVGNIWKTAFATASVAANSIDIANGSLIAPAEASTLKSAIGNSLTVIDGTNNGAADRLAFRASTVASGPPSGENITSGTIYYSFLLNVGSLTGSNNVAGDYFISLNNTANAATTTNPTVVPGQMRIRIDPTDSSKYDIGMFTQRTPTQADVGWSNNTTVGTPISLTTGQTYFVVGAYDNIGGSTTNRTRLWINPDQTFFGGATPAPITAQDNTAGSNFATIGSLLLHQRNLNPDLAIDELRVGTLWSEVTPLGTATLYWDLNGSTLGAGSATPTGTWDSVLANTSWNNASDGQGNAVPWAGGSVAVFAAGTDATGAYTINVTGAQSAAGLIFEDGTPTLSGGSVSLTGLHTITTNTGVTASMGTAIDGSVGVVKDGAGTLVLTGNQTFSGTTSINFGTIQLGDGGTTGTLPTGSAIVTNSRLTINRSNAVVQGTDFSGAAITGTGGLTQAGSGTLTLNAANTYSGTTRAAAGTLLLTDSLALQNSTLDMNIADAGSVSFGSLPAVTLGGLTGSRNLALTSSSVDYNGNGTVDAPDYVLWRKSPSGFGGDPAGYNAWRAQFGNPGSSTLAVSIGNNVASPTAPYTGVLSGSGTSLTKIGSSSQVLSGANTYNGGTTINAGTLQFGQTVAMPASGAVTVNSGGTLAVNANGAGEWTESAVTTDPASIAGLIAGTGGQGTANQVTWNAGSALAIDTTNAAGELTYAGVIGSFRTTGGGTTNAVGFTKRGTGKLILSGNNTFSGPLSIASSSGTLQLTGTNSNAGTTATIPTVGIGGNSTLELGISNSLPSGTLINTQGGSAQMFLQPTFTQTIRSLSGNNGVVTVQAGAVLTIADQAGDDYVFGSGASTANLRSVDTAKIYKTGAGTLTLFGDAGANFNGEFIMQNGRLNLSRNQALGTTGGTGKLTVTGGQLGRTNTPTSNFTYSLGLLDMQVFRFDLSDAPAQTSQITAGTITTLKANDVEINITNSGTQTGTSGRFVFLGDIRNHDPSPAGGDDTNAIRGITKTGNGILLFSASGSVYPMYKGSTTVQDGVLLVNSTATLGDYTQATIGTLNLKGGLFATADGRTTPVKNPIDVNGNGAIGFLGNGAQTAVLMELDNNSVVGTSGSLTITNAGSNTTTSSVFQPRFTGNGFNFGLPIVISGSVTVGTGIKTNELQVGNLSDTQTFSGAISGGGSVRRVNAGGTTVLSGTNTYTGTTQIDAGTLLLNGANTGGGAVTFNGGGTLGGTGSTTSAVALSSGGTIAPGAVAPAATIESLDVGSLGISGGLLSFELNAPGSPGVDSDLLNVTVSDALTILSGTVDLINAGGLTAGTYTLIDYVGTALGDPTVDLLTLGAQPGGFTYDLVDNGGNTSIDLVVTAAGSGSVSIGAVPEPSALMLVVLTIGPALVASRRASRRRKS